MRVDGSGRVSADTARAKREESIFVTVFMTAEPVVQAALTCLSTKELGRVGTASPTLRMHEAIVEHMRTAMIATTAACERVIALQALNVRLWHMLFPRDMTRLAETGAHGLYLPVPPGEDWERREEEDRAFAAHLFAVICRRYPSRSRSRTSRPSPVPVHRPYPELPDHHLLNRLSGRVLH